MPELRWGPPPEKIRRCQYCGENDHAENDCPIVIAHGLPDRLLSVERQLIHARNDVDALKAGAYVLIGAVLFGLTLKAVGLL